jgi:DNA repair exonuclease SbcCD ATPase subunit
MGYKSRRVRFEEVLGKIMEAKEEVEMLRDELQEWLDNLPENLQEGTKADELQEAIDNLEECLGSLEEAEETNVDFPGMY